MKTLPLTVSFRLSGNRTRQYANEARANQIQDFRFFVQLTAGRLNVGLDLLRVCRVVLGVALKEMGPARAQNDLKVRRKCKRRS